MLDAPLLQIVYISSVVGSVDTAQILAVSRRNNARDGLTGLLYADGRRFLQVLEGEPVALERTLERITADTRHRAVVILSCRDIATREFGAWAMAERVVGESGDAMVAQVQALIVGAAPAVRATFDSFVQLRRAA